MNKSIPLVVDLDGTLVRDDTLYVHAWQLLTKKPLDFLQLPFKLRSGKAAMKQFMSQTLDFDPSSLRYNESLCDWLKDQKTAGREIVLCTASSQQVAQIVADEVGVFDRVIGSKEHTNLAGENKAKLLVKEYAEKGFDYCGNSSADLAVWQVSHNAIVVNAKKGLAEKAVKLCHIAKIFS